MRVMHVVVTENFAGVERYVTSVATELAARGHSVGVVGGQGAQMRRALPAAVLWAPGATPLAALPAVLAMGRSDILHVHMTKAELVGVLAKVPARSRLVATRHFARGRGSSPGARAFSRFVNRMADRQLAVSAYVGTRLEKAPHEVLLSGVPLSDNRYDADSKTVLVVQRLEAEKESLFALRVWASSGLAASGWRLRILGDGDERPALERAARELEIEGSVEFAGWAEDVAAELASASVLLATTPVEAFGFSVVEAMAAAVPVVAVASGGHLETLGPVGGCVLYPRADLVSAALALRALAEDPDRRMALGLAERSRQRTHLSIGHHVDALERVYTSLART